MSEKTLKEILLEGLKDKEFIYSMEGYNIIYKVEEIDTKYTYTRIRIIKSDCENMPRNSIHSIYLAHLFDHQLKSRE